MTSMSSRASSILARRLSFLLVCLMWPAAPGVSQTTERASVDSAGVEANSKSLFPSISADGRFVVFESYANILVPGDTNSKPDVFVHDCWLGLTSRVSVDSAGVEGDGRSGVPSISADGRFVAFISSAANLVPGDANGERDIFVHDRSTGRTTRVSVDSAGAEGNSWSIEPSISADGNFVAFACDATNLVPGDTNSRVDILVHDRQTGQTTRVSVDSAGQESNGSSFYPSLSADGRFIAFGSTATNLVPGDTNDRGDTFVHDRWTGQTTRVSVDSAGTQSNDGSWGSSSLSSDGRFVTFSSWATNLVPGDTNGDQDVFVRDRLLGQTTRVSVDSAGREGHGYSDWPSISADGRSVTFYSAAPDLVSGDTNDARDIFVHDRQTGTTVMASVDSTGVQGNDDCSAPSISSGGHFVAFHSWATNLVAGDTNACQDVFVRFLGGIPRLAVYDLVSGGTATIKVGWATAGGTVRHAYSIAGGGPMNTPHGLLLLSPPIRELPRMTANARGVATLALSVPPGVTGISVWFHAFDVASLTFTNGVAAVIG